MLEGSDAFNRVRVFSDFGDLVRARKDGFSDADIFCGTDYRLGFLEDFYVTFKALSDSPNLTCTDLNKGSQIPVSMSEVLSTQRLQWLLCNLRDYKKQYPNDFRKTYPSYRNTRIDINKFLNLLLQWEVDKDLTNLKTNFKELINM